MLQESYRQCLKRFWKVSLVPDSRRKIMPTPVWFLFSCSADNWLVVLEKEYKKRNIEAPFDSPLVKHSNEMKEIDDSMPAENSLHLNDLGLEVKVKILFDLCEFHLENIQYFHDHVLRGYDAGPYLV